MLEKTYNAFGAEEVSGEPHYHKHIRDIAITWACRAHLETCITSTRDKFVEFMEGDRVAFPSDTESALFCNGNRKTDMNGFNSLWRLFNNSADASRRSFYLKSMGCIENDAILSRFIETIIESGDVDNVNNNEWLTIVEAVYSNGPIGLSVALRFMRNNYDELIGL